MTLPASGPLTLSDIQTEFGGTNPIGMNEYYAGGGLVPAGTSGTYGAVPSSGALSVQNFYGTTAFTPIYIEEVFSTWLYTGTGAAQTITNGIDLSTKGGLVWTKGRDYAFNHWLIDTVRGKTQVIKSNTTDGNQTLGGGGGAITSFNTNGYGVNLYDENNSPDLTFASWTFRKQPKFFDVQTFTTNSSNGATFAHNLGSVPGCLIVKSLASADSWIVWHRGLTGGIDTNVLVLNATNGQFSIGTTTTATSTTITIGNGSLSFQNAPYVAYLFAHDAGGFGLTGTDNVISCGSFTNSGSTVDVNLGYEAQFVLMKKSSGTGNWFLFDTMRGMAQTSFEFVYPNLSGAAEFKNYQGPFATATGFSFNPVNNGQFTSGTYIYIAIRRGPMKVPTSGTSVFSPNSVGSSVNSPVTTNFPIDLQISNSLTGDNPAFSVIDRLRIFSSTTDQTRLNIFTQTNWAETVDGAQSNNWGSLGFAISTYYSGINAIYWNFRRAPKFFDAVCYTASSSSASITHNLTVRPEMVIYKTRNSADSWYVCVDQDGFGQLNSTAVWGGTGNGNGLTNIAQATSTTINNLGGFFYSSGQTIVSYLFATCAGVSKVGSYTGTGATQTINCGFTSGARFVLIKRTNTQTTNWNVVDTARGMVAGNDFFLFLNSTSAQVNADHVYTTSVGFQLVSSNAGFNASGGTYIYLAIA